MCFVLALLLAGLGAFPALGAGLKQLHGHVPEAVALLKATGRMPATNQLHLAIGLPLRDPAGLDTFLAQLYDPASPNYRHYVTPQEFADRFGPTPEDYEAVKEFARTNGLTVTATYGNRLVLDVAGPAVAVERAFHVNLHTFQHPTESRQFFAPDSEPTLDVSLPVTDISGLNNYWRPHPKVHRRTAQPGAIAKGGTAPDGTSYLGQDLRNAYIPGVTLTGAGQSVGLFQFDGFKSNNILAYEDLLPGKPRVPLTTVLLDGYDGSANGGEVEVCLDIEMAIGMAPGLSRVVIFEGNLQNSILGAMVSSNMIKNLSCSWGWGGGPKTTTDILFKNLAAQGQSFFDASGDTDAFAAGSNNDVDSATQANAPSSCPFITQVGGTVLAMNGSGDSYSSETVWNDRTVNDNGGNWGSSGGISTYYSSINCPWQTNLNLTVAKGSKTKRNIPDVALIADSAYIVSGNGVGSPVGGTSVAAPLWAGFMALVNQQAAAIGRPSAGFINPAIYAIAASSNYAACFHDTTTGDNTWSPSSPTLFHAVAGYDLCTGLGTPNGAALIDALAGPPDALIVSPIAGYAFTGPYTGPFDPGTGVFQLTNTSDAVLNWSLINTSAWLTASSTGGTLAAHAAIGVDLSPNATANLLGLGSYASTIAFTNPASHAGLTYPLTLQVYQPLSVSPAKGFTAVGPVGGPFSSASQIFALTNLGNGTVNWSLVNTSVWLTVSPTSGSLAAGGSVNLNAGIAAAGSVLGAGVYATSVVISDPLGVVAALPVGLSIGQPVILNGGFETGDFTSWTQSGNTGSTSVTSSQNGPTYVHSGTGAAKLGPPYSLGYLSQNLTTVAGQNYILSFWLRNPQGTTPNQFQVQWDGVAIFSAANLTSTGWTNLQFVLNAPSSVTPLQFSFQHDPDYFGLDDVTVTALTPPTFKATVKAGGNFQFTWSTTTGITYQVQYKTNLAQAAWLNLGSVFTAKTNTQTLTDTNALTASAQRYYRLQVSP